MKFLPCLFVSLMILSNLPAETPKKTEDVSFHYLDALKAYEALLSAFPDSHKIVKSIHVDVNTSTLNSDYPMIAAVKDYLVEIDVRPKQILLQLQISTLEPHGVKKIIAQPMATMIDGKTANFTIAEFEGKKLMVQVTAKNIPENPVQVRDPK